MGPEADLLTRQRKFEKAEKRGVLTVARATAAGASTNGHGDGDGGGGITWREKDEEEGRRAETVDLAAAERSETEPNEAEEPAQHQAESKPATDDDEKDDTSGREAREDLRTGPTGGTIGRS